MTPQERKETIKALTKGNVSELKALQETRSKDTVSTINIYLTFYFLLDCTDSERTLYVDAYDANTFHSTDDLSLLNECLQQYKSTNEFTKCELKALDMIFECMECYSSLKAKGELGKLEPYRKIIDNL